jgi:hypothetical protein
LQAGQLIQPAVLPLLLVLVLLVVLLLLLLLLLQGCVDRLLHLLLVILPQGGGSCV